MEVRHLEGIVRDSDSLNVMRDYVPSELILSGLPIPSFCVSHSSPLYKTWDWGLIFCQYDLQTVLTYNHCVLFSFSFMNLTLLWLLPWVALDQFLSVPLGWTLLIVDYFTWNNCCFSSSNFPNFLFTVQIETYECSIFTSQVRVSQTIGECLPLGLLGLSHYFFQLCNNKLKDAGVCYLP